jgi:hypothetical protein
MTPSNIASIREQVARAGAALREPGADFTGVLLGLESAVEGMRGLGADTPLAELEALRVELARVATLAHHGEDFWRSWGRLLGLEPGYTPAGVLAAEQSISHIAVEG